MHAAALYFVASFAFDFKLFRDSLVEDPKLQPQLTYLVPLSAVEAFFTFAAFRALHSSLRHLKAKGSNFRLVVYRCFAVCMCLVVIAVAGYLTFEAYFHATHPQFEKWQFEWVCFSHSLALVGLPCGCAGRLCLQRCLVAAHSDTHGHARSMRAHHTGFRTSHHTGAPLACRLTTQWPDYVFLPCRCMPPSGTLSTLSRSRCSASCGRQASSFQCLPRPRSCTANFMTMTAQSM
jgi:hypothetical protein